MSEVNSVLIVQDRLECWVRHQNKLTSCNYEIPQSYWLSIYPHIKDDQITLPWCDCRVTFRQVCCLGTRKCQSCDKEGQLLQMRCKVIKNKFTFTCFECIQKDGEKEIQNRKNQQLSQEAYSTKIQQMQKLIGQNNNRNRQLEQQLRILRNEIKNLEQSLTLSNQNLKVENQKFKSTLYDYHNQNETLRILQNNLEIQRRNVEMLEQRVSQLTDERQLMEKMLDQKNIHIEQISSKISELERQIENKAELPINQELSLKNDGDQFSSQNLRSFKGSLAEMVCQQNQHVRSDFQMTYNQGSSQLEQQQSSNEQQSSTYSRQTIDFKDEQQLKIAHKPSVTKTVDFIKKKTAKSAVIQLKKKPDSANKVRIASEIYQTAPLSSKKQTTVEEPQQADISPDQQVQISNPLSSSAITDTSESHPQPMSPYETNPHGQSDVQTQSNTGSNYEQIQSNMSFNCSSSKDQDPRLDSLKQ